MTETFRLLSGVSFLLSGVLGMAAVVFWLQFHIPAAVGELSGRAAKRAVRRLREDNKAAAEQDEEITEPLDNIMIIHTDEVIEEEGLEKNEEE